MFKKIGKHLNIFKFVVTFLLIVAVFAFGNFYLAARNAAESVGGSLGEVSGKVKGITEGRKDGKDTGLTTNDFRVEVMETLAETGKLEVLVANAAIHDDFNIGKEYEALYIYKGNAVFTVDLTITTVTKLSEVKMKVVLPEPKVQFIPNEEETQKIFDKQKGYFTGSREDGYKAYMNQMNYMNKHVEEYIVGYELLMESAKKSAVRQIQSLVKAICGKDYNVEVEFSTEEVDS